jgi:hypothetical protein
MWYTAVVFMVGKRIGSFGERMIHRAPRFTAPRLVVKKIVGGMLGVEKK